MAEEVDMASKEEQLRKVGLNFVICCTVEGVEGEGQGASI